MPRTVELEATTLWAPANFISSLELKDMHQSPAKKRRASYHGHVTKETVTTTANGSRVKTVRVADDHGEAIITA